MGSLLTRVHEEEDGVYVLLFSLLLVVLFGMAAMAVDASTHVDDRQELHDTLDAAAHAGATFLPDDAVGARAAAIAYARENDPELVGDADVAFWCIVTQDDDGTPRDSQIPLTCDPGPYAADEPVCDGRVCAIPCKPFLQGDRCNTVQVFHGKDVPYTFGPVIGVPEGNTGRLVSAACKGPCGAELVGPLDLVLVLDRTPSMRPEDVASLKAAARGLLEHLDPDKHRVALAVHGPSVTSGGCPTHGVAQDKSDPSFPLNGGSSWLAVPFSQDYDPTDSSPPDDPPVLADPAASLLVKGIECLDNSVYGTNLGDAVHAAGAYLAANRREDVPGGVLFMSDGEPTLPKANGSTGDTVGKLKQDCHYARSRAADARALGAQIVTIAYRLQGVGTHCNHMTRATELLADMASPTADGAPTLDDGASPGNDAFRGGCDDALEIADENGDGDNFFCAPSPSQLGEVFIQAAIQLTDAIRLVRVQP